MPLDQPTEAAPFRQAIYRFGRFTFHGASQELWADGVRRKLEAEPGAVLACLLAQPNFAVSKKDLIEAVWPGRKAVEPGSLLTAAYIRPLSHRITPPAGQPAIPPDVWLARNEKTREARVFKFATTQTRLDELKLEAAISSLLFARLGERRDLVRVLE